MPLSSNQSVNHFTVFGTHPRLSLAEFRCINPRLSAPTTLGAAALFHDLEWNGDDLMNRLGGTVKLGDIVSTTEGRELDLEALVETLAPYLTKPSIDFGWTVYGGSRETNKRLSKMALAFKKTLRAHDISARWVTGKDGSITPAAIAKLNLTTEGLDLNIFIDGERLHVGRTTNVQDADAWSLRDFGRPARDERVGMLPPKLARMMANLASATNRSTLWDPFCGGGTVLMEAALATHAKLIIGSDLDATQTANAQRNTSWLTAQRIFEPTDAQRIVIFQADARSVAPSHHSNIDAIVTEGYLGPPLTGHETKTTLDKNVHEISKLWEESLLAWKPLLAKHARLVCIWPAFKTSHGIARVDLESRLPHLGYRLVNPLEGWDDSNGPLLYARPDQRVMRRIVVLEKL
jgi:tRNA G10  N-methylase Trm11